MNVQTATHAGFSDEPCRVPVLTVDKLAATSGILVRKTAD
jgi:hypothetical protein